MLLSFGLHLDSIYDVLGGHNRDPPLGHPLIRGKGKLFMKSWIRHLLYVAEHHLLAGGLQLLDQADQQVSGAFCSPEFIHWKLFFLNKTNLSTLRFHWLLFSSSSLIVVVVITTVLEYITNIE